MRIRISFQKIAQLRFTSTLDLQTIWERSLRRANVRIEYSQGFHPQPRIQLGIPLPLGFNGLDEKVDIWIKDIQPMEELYRKLHGKLPAGLSITSIEEITSQEKSLSSQIQYSLYKVILIEKIIVSDDIQSRIDELLAKEEIIRTKRNGKKYDLKPLIDSIELICEQDCTYINLRLFSQPNKTGRADEVMFALGFSIIDFLVERLGSYV